MTSGGTKREYGGMGFCSSKEKFCPPILTLYHFAFVMEVLGYFYMENTFGMKNEGILLLIATRVVPNTFSKTKNGQ